jgi:hypothetical protein
MTAANRLTSCDRLLIFGVALIARFALLIWVVVAHIDPFRWSSDSWEYMASMMAIRDNNWGYFLFISRTPGYPLLLRGFNALFNLDSPQMVFWLPFQAVMTAISVVLAAHLLFRLTHNRNIALFSSLLLAVSPLNLSGEVPMLSEGLFNLTLIVAQLCLLRWLERRRLADFLICLVALQINVLTRPNGQFFIVIAVAIILIRNWRLWRYAVLLVVGLSLPIIAWTAHNNYYFHINTYSAATVINMLFYKAVSTESMVTGRSPDDVTWDYARTIETRLGNLSKLNTKYFPTANYDYLYVNDPARYKVMADLATEKLLQFHVWHLVKIPYTIYKQFSSFDTLSRLVPNALQPVLTFTTILLAVLGIWRWIRLRRQLWQHILVLGTIAYFLFGTAFYNPIPTMRYMSPFGAYWVLMIVLGVTQVYELLRVRRQVAPAEALLK